jgi:hypothetical protein
MAVQYDFSGYATRNDLRCSDGRTIRKNAFKDCDGKRVPLVWNHQHDDISNVIGYADLENVSDGVLAHCAFNNTERGKEGRECVQHGDVVSLSIYANQLKQIGGDVLHGMIREVSLVLAGANPGAYIEEVLTHGDEEGLYSAEIYSGEPIELCHADEEEEKEKKPMADNEKKETESEKTIGEIVDSMTDEQKKALYALVGMAAEGAGADDEDEDEESEGGSEMKHNAFDDASNSIYTGAVPVDMALVHSAAKKTGSYKQAVNDMIENGELTHAMTVPMDGMTGPSQATASQTYGFRDPDMLFPEYKSLNTPPEWIKRDTGWVSGFLNGAHHLPFSRIKSQFADLTGEQARARGYLKGHTKKEQVFSLLKRTTDPQTIYKKQKMDRDDTIDIVDFDVIAWIKGEMRGQLDEEIARAGLIGDGRLASDDDKISEDHIRPIATDVPLFTIRAEVDAGKNEQEMAKNFIVSAIKARKNYKGSGNPTLYTTEDMLTNMLLIEDGIGHFLYKSVEELATRLRVSKIVTVEVMEGFHVDTTDFDQETGVELLGIIVNPADYSYGADKGGAVALFDDFDIDVNQMKYLIETRCSGALTKPFRAIRLTKKTA